MAGNVEGPSLVSPFIITALIVGGLAALGAYYYITSTKAGKTRLSGDILQSAAASVTEAKLKQRLADLLAKGARPIGDNSAARTHLQEQLESFGYQVQLESFTSPRAGVNIIAEKVGRKKTDEILEVGAHYDTRSGVPGADDNGTGVTATLEIAEFLSQHKTDRSVRFVLFDGEEAKLLGSTHHVGQIKQGPKVVLVMGEMHLPSIRAIHQLIQVRQPQRPQKMTTKALTHPRKRKPSRHRQNPSGLP